MVAGLAAVSLLGLSSLALGASHSPSSHPSKVSSEASKTITSAAKAAKTALASAAAVTTYETTSPLPLTDYSYAYSAIPSQVNPYAIGRGPQSGTNICNNSTEGADSQCQTLIANSIDDFCLWGAPGLEGNETIGDIEAAVVAYCSRSGHGARILPPGTITAVQFMRTSAYFQITGLLDQTGIGLAADDTGGELDPHGADLMGNPLGGLVYTTSMYADSNSTAVSAYTQVNNWNIFVGGGIFCAKFCYNNVTKPDYCQNKFDIIGCNYNMPASYAPDEFTSCDGDLQDEVGTYTGANGMTSTWSQPDVLPATSTLPWTPRIPASSNCVTYKSEDLYPNSLLGYLATTSATSTVVSTTSSVVVPTTTSTTAVTSRSTATSVATSTAVTSSSTAVSTSSSSSSAAPAATTSASSDAKRLVVGGAMGFALLGAVALLI